MEIIVVKGAIVVGNVGASIFRVNASKLRRPLDTVDLEELLDSRERAGERTLALCEGQFVVWELFSDNSFLSAIFDPQGLMVAAPALEQGKLRASLKAQEKKSQDRCDVPDCFHQNL